MRDVTLRFNVSAHGGAAPFVLAEERGYYAAQGLDVAFGEGNGSDVTVQSVAKGHDDFGLASLNVIAKLVAEGAEVKTVAVIQQKSPLAVITLGDSKVRTAKDLEGATVALGQGDVPLFNAFARAAGIDPSKVNLVTLSDSAQSSALAAGKIDGLFGWATFQSPQIKKLTGGVGNILLADYGFVMPNLSLVTSQQMLNDHPNEVCKFVKASFQGWKYSVNHPAAAVKALTSSFPNLDPQIIRWQLKAQIESLRVPATKGKALGWIPEANVNRMLNILHKTGDLEKDIGAKSIYTNECFTKN